MRSDDIQSGVRYRIKYRKKKMTWSGSRYTNPNNPIAEGYGTLIKKDSSGSPQHHFKLEGSGETVYVTPNSVFPVTSADAPLVGVSAEVEKLISLGISDEVRREPMEAAKNLLEGLGVGGVSIDHEFTHLKVPWSSALVLRDIAGKLLSEAMSVDGFDE